jgi:hypothetical protein
MPTFPRVGIELSAYASITYPDDLYEHPALVVQFENGWKERRALTQNGRFKEFTLHCEMDETDSGVITDFLKAQQLCVTPFTLIHPFLGEGTCNYASAELPRKTLVHGSPAWFSFDLKFEGTF